MNLSEILDSLPSHHYWMKSPGSPWNATIRVSEIKTWWITHEYGAHDCCLPEWVLKSTIVVKSSQLQFMTVYSNLSSLVQHQRGKSCKICCALYCDGEVFAALNVDYDGTKLTCLDVFLIPEFNVGIVERALSKETADLIHLLHNP